MEKHKKRNPEDILPVLRTKDEARQFYDRMSRVYDYLTRPFEAKFAEMTLKSLSIQEGETVLEIGFGPGHCLKKIAWSVGETGKVHGIDISFSMLEVTRRKLEKANLMDRVELYYGDATSLPYDDDIFDAVFMSYTLELFDTPEIPEVLQETMRVLKPGGRLGVTSMSKENGNSRFIRLYEWLHRKWPKYFDCRPIYVEKALNEAKYKVKEGKKVKILGLLPIEIVIAMKKC